MKILKFSFENQEKHANQKQSMPDKENHTNHRSPLENYENQEKLSLQCQNQQKS